MSIFDIMHMFFLCLENNHQTKSKKQHYNTGVLTRQRRMTDKKFGGKKKVGRQTRNLGTNYYTVHTRVNIYFNSSRQFAKPAAICIVGVLEKQHPPGAQPNANNIFSECECFSNGGDVTPPPQLHPSGLLRRVRSRFGAGSGKHGGCAATLAPHCGHGDGGAGHRGVLSLPL